MFFRKHKIISLDSNIPLSKSEYQITLNICHLIKQLIKNRDAIVSDMRQSYKIAEPGFGWELKRKFYNSVYRILSGDYEVINHLRLFAQQFTGYQLISLSNSAGKVPPVSIPDNLKNILKRHSKTDPSIKSYSNITKHLPPWLHIGPPNRFGEIGWQVQGNIVNHDSCVYLERMGLLYETGLLEKLRELENPTILEIGGGYGGLAYLLKQVIPNLTYIDVDLPESLLYAAIYLAILFPEKSTPISSTDSILEFGAGLSFVPNFCFDAILKNRGYVDLVINTLSMSEMTELQVRTYCLGIRKILKNEGVFFEQNQDNRSAGMLKASDIIGEYFNKCLPISSSNIPLTQGTANIWKL